MSEHVNSTPVTRPGISAAMLTALGIRHVGESEAFNLVGQRYSGLYIPVVNGAGTDADHRGKLTFLHQLRLGMCFAHADCRM